MIRSVSFGAVPDDDGTTFTVWAPQSSAVAVVIDDRPDTQLTPLADGTWSAHVPGVGHGERYRFRLDGHEPLPDPASGHQPDGVHGPSAVVDTRRFRWTDTSWRGVALADCLYYELHVATFTEEGTFASAAAELPRLRDLGITMVELMPVNAFPGRRNWGYDGVFASAVQDSYGGPDGLAAFVDTAHASGVGVTLDVVYNHFGPEGNVAGAYGPWFTDVYTTPWGDAVNFSEAGSAKVRGHFVESACRWVRDFHIDGLRVDAVHAIVDPTARPFVAELTEAVHATADEVGREVIVVAESAANDPAVVRHRAAGGLGFDAQWNDDYHHALRVALTGDTAGYYDDYSGGAADLADAYRHGFVVRGRHSSVRGRPHGAPLDGRPDGATASVTTPEQLVVFAQNHDQIGNRPDGARLDTLVDDARRRLATALVLLSPFTPLVFMGSEYGDPAPFAYFVDHGDPDLLEAVRAGRAREFAGFDWSGDLPDPASLTTMDSAVLNPAAALTTQGRSLTAMMAGLVELRRTHPAWVPPRSWPEVHHDDGLLTIVHPGDDGPALIVVANLTAARRRLDRRGRVIFSTFGTSPTEPGTEVGDLDTLPAWSAVAIEPA